MVSSQRKKRLDSRTSLGVCQYRGIRTLFGSSVRFGHASRLGACGHLKLQRSLRDGCLFDLPPQTVKRYLKDKTISPRVAWPFNHKLRSLVPGKLLRIELMSEATIHWTDDNWKTCHDTKNTMPGWRSIWRIFQLSHSPRTSGSRSSSTGRERIAGRAQTLPSASSLGRAIAVTQR